MENAIVVIISMYLMVVTILESYISLNFICRDPIWYPKDLYNKINKFWSWFIFIIIRIISPVITILFHGSVFIAYCIYNLACYMIKKYYTRRKLK